MMDVAFDAPDVVIVGELVGEIAGASVAGEGTCIVVPKLGICFDIGRYLSISSKQKTVLVSHGHCDHISALPSHARVRGMIAADKPTYIVPKSYVSGVKDLIRAVVRLDQGKCTEDDDKTGPIQFGNDDEDGVYEAAEMQAAGEDEYPFKIIEASAQIRIPLGNYYVIPFETLHRVPSLGYVVYQTQKQLKECYRGQPSSEIGAAVKRGEQVNDIVEKNLLAFTGDTCIEGVLSCAEALTSHVLIMECTFLSDVPVETAMRTMHIHISQLVEHQDKFKNDHIVLIHFSARYTREFVIRSVAESGLSPEFLSRTQLLLGGLRSKKSK